MKKNQKSTKPNLMRLENLSNRKKKSIRIWKTLVVRVKFQKFMSFSKPWKAV
jgi:hypothetical protein